ncbi:MAG: hypothetical protein NXI23_00260 [Bacteroidetes bacterium]|jgi:hypothetical protein|nr:hypothetical protein [Bacteroidota bacterium]MDF1865463.1 hypothetical protein [Saprospiraceae bacterium]
MELKSKAFSGARWMTFGTVIRFILQVAQVFFSDMLNPKKAVYPQFVDENFEKKYLNPHLKKQGNFVEMISRTVTLEYWLRKVLGY